MAAFVTFNKSRWRYAKSPENISAVPIRDSITYTQDCQHAYKHHRILDKEMSPFLIHHHCHFLEKQSISMCHVLRVQTERLQNEAATIGYQSISSYIQNLNKSLRLHILIFGGFLLTFWILSIISYCKWIISRTCR